MSNSDSLIGQITVIHKGDFNYSSNIIRRVPTRYLIIASAVVGLAILVAGAIWFLRLYV